MKKTITIKVDLPERAAAAAGLRLRVPDAAVRAVADAEAQLAQARVEAIALAAAVDRVKADVVAGRATVADLEVALAKRDAAALLIAPAGRRLVDAQAAHQAAIEAARRELAADATALRDELQAVADQVSPVLEELSAIELMLDDVVRRDGALPAGVPALTWPSSIADGYVARQTRELLAQHSTLARP